MQKARKIVVMVAILTIGGALTGLASAQMSGGGGVGDPTGALPTSVPVTVAAGEGLKVEMFTAADGLCFRSADATGRGSTTACINPAAAPYDDPGGVELMLHQKGEGRGVVLGFAPASARSVEVQAAGESVRVATRALPVSAKLASRFFAARLADDNASATALVARDDRGRTITRNTL